MLHQVQNRYPSAWLQYAPGFRNRPLRMQRVVERLTEQRHIYRAIGNWDSFQIPLAVLQRCYPLLLR